MLFLLLLFPATLAVANQAQDSTAHWYFHGTIVTNNNGIAPVPAFALGKPALMTSLEIKNKAFSFNPEFNYALDSKPWVFNTWLRYTKQYTTIQVRIGANYSTFFSRVGEGLVPSQYLVSEFAASYRLSEKYSVNVLYWGE